MAVSLQPFTNREGAVVQGQRGGVVSDGSTRGCLLRIGRHQVRTEFVPVIVEHESFVEAPVSRGC
jgi:hypothetical protein